MDKKKFEIDTLFNFKTIGGLKKSDDNRFLLAEVTEADRDENKYSKKLYLYDREKETFSLFANDLSGYYYFDKDFVVFKSSRASGKKDDKDGKESSKFYKISLARGEAELFLDVDKNISFIEPVGEDKFLVLYSYDHVAKINGKDKDDYIEIDENPFYFNGSGFVAGKRDILAIYNAKDKTFKDLTDKYTSSSGVKFSKDRKKALFLTESYEKRHDLTNSIYELDIEKEEIRPLLENYDSIYSAFYFKGDVIANAKGDWGYGVNEEPHFYKVLDKKLTLITDKDDPCYGNSVGTDIKSGKGSMIRVEGESIYYNSTNEYRSTIYKLEGEKISGFYTYDGSLDDYIFLDKMYFTGIDKNHGQELYVLDGNKAKRLSSLNSFVDDFEISEPEMFEFENDGVKFKGFVIKPDIKEGEKAPCILTVHGGPKTVFGDILNHEIQVLAAKGYFVIYTNPRGADGRGNDFMDIRGKYGDIDFKDLMKFTDLALEKYPAIDKDRLGIIGGSYGGFMTNWAIGHTERFKAAVSQRCISNWISFYGTSDIGYFFAQDQTAANPWDNLEKAWQQSPLKYARSVKTPTLFIHSDEDYRCPLEQGLQMFNALNENKIDTRLVIFKGENHELSRSGAPLHRVKRLKELTSWLDKYLIK